MQVVTDNLAAGGNRTTGVGKHKGSVDWETVSNIMGRSIPHCSSIYNDERRKLREGSSHGGRFTAEEVRCLYMEVCVIVSY